MRKMYVCDKGTHLITHDGYIQLGIHHQTIEQHREMRHPEIEWHEVHWIPDIFGARYKRVAFQKTAACNEGSPKTDNEGCGEERPRDFPDGNTAAT